MSYHVAIALAVIVAVGCKKSANGEKKDRDKGAVDSGVFQSDELKKPSIGGRPAGAFLAHGDLQVSGSSKTETIAQFRQNLNSSNRLVNDMKSSDAPCAAIDSLPLKIDGNKGEAVGEVDYMACTSTSESVRYTSAKLKIYIWFQCKNANLVPLQGVTLGQALNEGRLEKICHTEGNTIAYFQNIKLQMTLQLVNSENSQKVINVTAVTASQTPDGQACVQYIKSNLYYHGACEHTSKTIFSDPAMPGTYEKISETNITGKEGERFYNSGVFNFQLNNWQGTVEQVDGRSSPKYTARSLSGETDKGSLAPTSSLQMTESKPSFGPRVLIRFP